MNPLNRCSALVTGAFLLVVQAFTSPLPSLAASNEPLVASAKVVKLTGTAKFRDAAGKAGTVTAGMTLAAGVEIETTPDATLALDLGVNGNILEISPASILVISRLECTVTGADYLVHTRLELKQGTINGQVKKLGSTSSYEIKTSQGLFAVRGTAFRIYANGTGIVWSGGITVTYVIDGVTSKPVLVGAGMAFAPPSVPGGEPVVFKSPIEREPVFCCGEAPLPPQAPEPVIVVSPITGAAVTGP